MRWKPSSTLYQDAETRRTAEFHWISIVSGDIFAFKNVGNTCIHAAFLNIFLLVSRGPWEHGHQFGLLHGLGLSIHPGLGPLALRGLLAKRSWKPRI